MQFCSIFNYTSGSCQQCITYYQQFNGYCRPINCQYYSSNNITCTNCLPGYVLTNNNICQIGNCQTFNQTLCLVCISGYYLTSNGLCASYCSQFDNNNVCLQCISAYSLNNLNQCVKNIAGCQTYSNTTCVACQPGLQLIQGICVAKYCLSYQANDSTICNTSLPRFYPLSNGLCYPRDC